ncbi:hypothetical protein HK100_012402 [Physocladia obscura]|uniref:UspA domain-containing protein n=1 Tax=Physocladia obscura TaxID=109957 RepID=A0AAD5XHN0_9FUNG|nr:hypothetical protein HK100_012402 [Physocladia obscura]
MTVETTVLISSADLEGFEVNRTVVIAVDSSKYSEYAVKWAASKFLTANDQVILLNVQPVYSFGGAASGDIVASSNGDIFAPGATEKLQELSKSTSLEILTKYADLLQGFKYDGVYALGDAKDVIVAKVNAISPDLLIVGSRGNDVLSRSVIGSVSDYCVHHVHSPVLIAKPKTDELEAMDVPKHHKAQSSIFNNADIYVALQLA